MCRALAELDIDSDEYKTAADAVIIAAKQAAKAHLAADRGTHVHLLTEDFDEGRDWIARAEAGELVDLDRDLQNALVAGWHRMLAEQQLQILAVEATCVDDLWRLAGTLDRIVRTGKVLRFTKAGGEIVEIPAGTVLVGDVKTSNKRLDRNGIVQYWQAFAIQIASYAQSRPYDTDTETRGDWPWLVSQDHAVIMHPDIDTCEWELIYVDLILGREHGGQCVVDAKAWESRTDLFSVAQLDSSQVSPMTATTAGVGEPALAPAPSSVLDPATIVDPTVNDLLPRAGMPQHALDEIEVDRLNDIRRNSAVHQELRRTQTMFEKVDARNTLSATPDQGANLTHPEFELLWAKMRHEYDTLPPEHRAWINELSSQATQRNLTFHTRRCQTERSYHIAKALITTASGDGNPEIVRHLVASILGDVGYSEHVTVGWIVGSLDHKQAEQFAQLADEWATAPAIA